jgi:hypothetical protein
MFTIDIYSCTDNIIPRAFAVVSVTGCPNEAIKLNLFADAERKTPPDNYKVWEQERLLYRNLQVEKG